MSTIRDRIRKLLDMTVAKGCTEAEAMAAAEIASRLMRDHGIAAGDLEFDQEQVKGRRGARTIRAALWAQIGRCTNTAPIIDGTNIVYVGREPGPQIASYLHVVTDRAIDRELKAFRGSSWYRRRRTAKAKLAASQDFTAGMMGRIAQRLADLFSDVRSQDALVEARQELARRFPATAKVGLRNASGRYDDAVSAGYRAGDGVTLSRGIAGGAADPTLLGSRK